MNLPEQETQPSTIIPYGFCHCGCGQKTTIAINNHTLNGYRKGEPARYRRGHQGQKRPVPIAAIPFKIEGAYCRLIPLTQGFYTIVDEADYVWLLQWAWHAGIGTNGVRYASRQAPDGETIYMHKFILGIGRGKTVDHRSVCTLDNRRKNLRPATMSQQCANKRLPRNNTTGFKGVTVCGNKFRAMIRCKGKCYHLGLFSTPEQAHAAYLRMAIKLFGEFARGA